MSIEAMKLALEILEKLNKDGWILADFEDDVYASMDALRAAIEQAEKQEPVAWYEPGAYGNVTVHKNWAKENGWLPLYTAPPQPDLAKVGEVGVWGERQWHRLTDEEYVQIMQEADADAAKTGSVFRNLHRAIEAKLKEKNAL